MSYGLVVLLYLSIHFLLSLADAKFMAVHAIDFLDDVNFFFPFHWLFLFYYITSQSL